MTSTNDNQLYMSVEKCMDDDGDQTAVTKALTNDDNDNDDSNDSDGDVFTFQKRSFSKRSVTKFVVETTPLSAKRTRKRRQQQQQQQGSASRCDENLAAMNRKSRERLKKVAKIAAAESGSSSSSDDDDGDSGVHLMGGAATAISQRTAVRPPPRPAATAVTINFLDDSDDDDDDDECKNLPPPSQTSVHSLAQNGAVRTETCEALLKARTAKLELEKAQNYHAEDVYVPVTTTTTTARTITTPVAMPSCLRYQTPGSSTSTMRPNGSGVGLNGMGMPMQPPTTAAASANLGPLLKVTLRSVMVALDGKKMPPTSDVQTIRRNEPFDALRNRYLQSKKLSSTSTQIIMKFDGQTIALSKTPAFYDMEDEDMVDCEIRLTTTTTASPSITTTTTTTAFAASIPINPTQPPKGGGRSCRLKLVTIGMQQQQQQPSSQRHHQQQNTTIVQTFTIKQHQTVQVLMDQYKAAHNNLATAAPTNVRVSFKVDGEIMNVARTIESYDLEDDDQIDVVVVVVK